MNTPTGITHRAIETLRAAINGAVFVPGDLGYDQARRAWNLTADQRPCVVVLAGSAAGVVHAVRFARSRGVRIAAQGTGHGSEPLEPVEGVMLLRTSRMRRVGIDPASRTARAGAGALWQDVTVPAGRHAAYDYYNFQETPAPAGAVLPAASDHRRQPIKARYDPGQAIISAHPVWSARSGHAHDHAAQDPESERS